MKKSGKNGKSRLIALIVLCSLVFALFVGRLAWMQFVRADYYAEKIAQASQTSYTVALPAARGDIMDRGRVLLAQDETRYDAALRLPAPNGTEIRRTLAALRAVLPAEEFEARGGKDVETQLAAFCSAVWAGELTVATGLTGAEAAAVQATGLVQGGAVRLTPRGARSSPVSTLLPQTLGITGRVTPAQQLAGEADPEAILGQSGLEAAYDALLRGQDGTLRVTAWRGGSTAEETTRTPVAGATLVLTLDSRLQAVLQQAMQQQIETLRRAKPAGKGQEVTGGAGVVLDLTDGGILASVSLPGYDGNRYRSDYAALAADGAAPLLDRVCTGLYAPGSAFKPAVAVAALRSGTVAVTDTVPCTGRYTYYAGYQPGCLQLGHSGAVDMLTALQHSCNIYFYDVGRRLGVDVFSATAQALGLAADTGAELPQAAGRLTWSSDENYQNGLTLMAAIGQGNTAVTPLQLAAYVACIAKDGQRTPLHFAEKAVDSAGVTIWQYAPSPMPAVTGGAAVFAPVREGMVRMAGTLLALRDAPVTLGCKTGSPQLAETLPDGTHYTNSVLIAFAPAENPRIAVAIVLERGGGGANAAPILRAILDNFPL